MSPFYEAVYAAIRQIPPGRVSTYGAIARLVGCPRRARQVGYALRYAPQDVPCHRVVNRLGGLCELFQPDGVRTHRMLLELEGVPFTLEGAVDLPHCLWPTPE